MYDSSLYIRRRNILKSKIGSGLILFLGNEENPMDYLANSYSFRHDSSFLYFFGIDFPNLAAVIDIDDDKTILFERKPHYEDFIWKGSKPNISNMAKEVGIKETSTMDKLNELLIRAIKLGKRIHYLPTPMPIKYLKIGQLLGIQPTLVNEYASKDLIKAVVDQRSLKIKKEIDQIELAHSVTYEMHITAMKIAKAGVFEREIVGRMLDIIVSSGTKPAFPSILTINGQILHNHYYGNSLKKGRLVVNDSGAESPMHYASDITRTFPVSGKFTQKQKEIYLIVLNAQEMAINLIKPGIKYIDIHIQASRSIALGLKAIGLMKGDIDGAVEVGAHALFFPHGLGHMIGLDVHDMEDLGENFVGYDNTIKRSEQFGLSSLRLARELKQRFVITVEPGIYFIPNLIDKWSSEKKFNQFINYDKVEHYRDFGGIRIEDNIVVTEDGHRVIGKPIPKTVEEVEAIIASRGI